MWTFALYLHNHGTTREAAGNESAGTQKLTRHNARAQEGPKNMAGNLLSYYCLVAAPARQRAACQGVSGPGKNIFSRVTLVHFAGTDVCCYIGRVSGD